MCYDEELRKPLFYHAQLAARFVEIPVLDAAGVTASYRCRNLYLERP
jgi:hypothetical protein